MQSKSESISEQLSVMFSYLSFLSLHRECTTESSQSQVFRAIFSGFFSLTSRSICGRGVIRRGQRRFAADREQNLITRESYSFVPFFLFYANTMFSHDIPYSIRRCIIRYTMQRDKGYAIVLSCCPPLIPYRVI